MSQCTERGDLGSDLIACATLNTAMSHRQLLSYTRLLPRRNDAANSFQELSEVLIDRTFITGGFRR